MHTPVMQYCVVCSIDIDTSVVPYYYILLNFLIYLKCSLVLSGQNNCRECSPSYTSIHES